MRRRRKGDHFKVLSYGEEVIAQTPGDVETQLKMARSAESLGLLRLAFWLAEQARAQDVHKAGASPRFAQPPRTAETVQPRLAVCGSWSIKRRRSDPEAKRKMNDLGRSRDH